MFYNHKTGSPWFEFSLTWESLFILSSTDPSSETSSDSPPTSLHYTSFSHSTLTSDCPPPPFWLPPTRLWARCRESLTHFCINLAPEQASLVAQRINHLLQCRRRGLDPWAGKMPWRRERLPNFRILAWRIPWTEEPAGLQPMGSQSVTHLAYSRCSIYITWRNKWGYCLNLF